MPPSTSVPHLDKRLKKPQACDPCKHRLDVFCVCPNLVAPLACVVWRRTQGKGIFFAVCLPTSVSPPLFNGPDRGRIPRPQQPPGPHNPYHYVRWYCIPAQVLVPRSIAQNFRLSLSLSVSKALISTPNTNILSLAQHPSGQTFARSHSRLIYFLRNLVFSPSAVWLMQSFFDPVFFSSSPELLACGVRRAPAIRAMRTKALKAAWDLNIILEPSNENTASCYLLDLMEQSDFGSAGRPWSTAYISHVRTLAPNWRASSPASAAAEWAGFLMGEALISATHDQLLPCGPEPPALGDLLASLEKATPDPGFMLLFTSSRPYLMHVTSLARERHNNRSQPLSEAVVRKFMSALYELHSVLSLLLDRVDMAITPPGTDKPLVLDDSTVDALARAVAYGRSFGFSGIVLPFYRELQHRETSDASAQSERTRERQQHLRTQAHDLAVLGARELARGLRYLPKIHYAPVHWPTIRMFAEFCVEEAESGKQLSPEALGDLQTFADEMKLTGYSLDVASTPQAFALLQRLEGLINHAIVSLFIPTDGEWMEGAALDEEMGLN